MKLFRKTIPIIEGIEKETYEEEKKKYKTIEMEEKMERARTKGTERARKEYQFKQSLREAPRKFAGIFAKGAVTTGKLAGKGIGIAGKAIYSYGQKMGEKQRQAPSRARQVRRSGFLDGGDAMDFLVGRPLPRRKTKEIKSEYKSDIFGANDYNYNILGLNSGSKRKSKQKRPRGLLDW